MTKSQWSGPFPLEYFADVAKKSAHDVPDEPPLAQPYGTPLIDVRVGPIIRLLATLEHDSPLYRGTVLIVTHDETSTEIPVVDFEVGPENGPSKAGSFEGVKFHNEAGHTFWRYTIELQLVDVEQQVSYAINGVHKPHFFFYIPAISQSMNVVSFSCNGFSLATNTDDFSNSLWYDVMAQHKQNHYHVAIGGGDQLYCDKVKMVSKELQKWLELASEHEKTKAEFTDEMAQSLESFYMNIYCDWFGQGHWKGANGKTLQGVFPLALASIPTINIYDDHDIIDGYGTYKHETMNTSVFKGLGKIAFKYYMLFQHHTAPWEDIKEPSWIYGAQPGPYISEFSRSNYVRLGRKIGFLGLDCRTERRKDQVVSSDTYEIVFKRLQEEIDAAHGEIKHLLVLLGVPIAYPRLVWLEKLFTSPVLAPIRTLAQKGVVAKGLVNEFDGSVELLDDLEDHWCAAHHKKERNIFVGRLQGFGAKNGIRITILSGDVHLAAVGRFKSRIHKHAVKSKKIEANEHILQQPQTDPRLMFNVITSAITNAPPANPVVTLLQKRSKVHKFDHNTDEDLVSLFMKDVNGESRGNYMLNNKRNWADLMLYEQLPGATTASSDGKLPGLIDNASDADAESKLYTELEKNTIDRVAYPVMKESLRTCIHMEKTSKVVNSACVRYEVMIPPLVGKKLLEGIGEKS